MKKSTVLGVSALLVAGTANAALVGGYGQRYEAANFNGTIWTDTGTQGANATANGTFNSISVNGVAAVENTGAGVQMDFSNGADLDGAGYTIQTVIRIDAGNTSLRQGPIAFGDDGWSGVFMGARTAADGNVRVRGGNQGSGSGDLLQLESDMTGVTAGTWGVYTLLVDGGANPSITATLTTLDGTGIWSATADNGLITDINNVKTSGRLFGGDIGGGTETDDWRGAIADIVVYESALSTIDLAANAVEFNTLYAAIPEPATLGLIAAFGGGLLFVRRRFSI